ncbi:MAG: hypothetical protein M3N28_06475 [Actinomycetota bacterium]|nr:hypothetical protein [Actinomycetota bacterium]
MTKTSLDRRAVGVGAVATLGIAAVPIAVVRVVVGSQTEGFERNLWVVPVLALFVAFTVGGHTAAKARPAAPYRHAAASALTAFAAFVAFTLARRLLGGEGLSFPLVVTLAMLFQVTVSLALVGGYVAWRRSRSQQLRP